MGSEPRARRLREGEKECRTVLGLAGKVLLASSLAFWLGTRARASVDDQPAPPPPVSSPVLDHLEKTLSENYRKEIDQEENVWRTIPFFIAGLAFEVSIITQVKDAFPGLTGWLLYTSISLILISIISVIASLYYLLLSINFAKFKYIASEPELSDFAYKLELAEAEGRIAENQAIRSFKMALISQYAVTTANNRAINSRRVRSRTSAGFAILVSILATLLLGGGAVFPRIVSSLNLNAGSNHGDTQSASPGGRAAQRGQPGGDGRDDGDRTAPDPGGPQGSVHAPGKHRER